MRLGKLLANIGNSGKYISLLNIDWQVTKCFLRLLHCYLKYDGIGSGELFAAVPDDNEH